MFGDPVRNPKGWKTARIGEFCKVGTGGTPSRDNPIYFIGSIPWVKTTEVNNNKIYDTSEKISELALSESNCKVFPKETILVALYGQGLTRGRASLLQIESCTNQACAAILPSEKFISLFLWQQLLHFYQHLRSISRGGNQPNLNLSFIKNLLVIDPPYSLQQQFAELVQKTEALKEKQKASEKELENLFNSLMQKAFKGELM
jgi:type I restriction enzyme S subunit